MRLGARLVFRRTNWTLHADEQWAILGRNGSGKSLFAAALSGEVPVVEGSINYHFPARPGESPEHRVACVSFEQQRGLAGDSLAAARWFSLEQEESALVSDILTLDSVHDINPFAVDQPNMSRAAFAREQKHIVQTLGITSLLQRKLVQLSNGEMRKILIARALLKKPKLLILDDPLAGLDADYRKRFLRLIADLARRRDMRLLITATRAEDLPAAVTHIALVNRCHLVQQGPRKQMLRDPRVASLLAPARLRTGRNKTRTKSGRELLRLVNARIAFGPRTILRSLTWTVYEGESWAILGRNGAGKSALLSLIAGNLAPASADEIVFFGRRRGEGESRAWIRKHLGEMAPEQHLHFSTGQTVFESILTGFSDTIILMNRPSSIQRREAIKWIRRFGLQALANEPMHSLSAGHQRMALLARALVRKPKLLLLDEPCQGLDAHNRRVFLEALQQLIATRRTTALYTTHRADEIPPAIRHTLRIKNSRATCD